MTADYLKKKTDYREIIIMAPQIGNTGSITIQTACLVISTVLSWNLCLSWIRVADGMLSWHSDYRVNVDNLSPEQTLGLELDWYAV